jgi:hypothetical protein
MPTFILRIVVPWTETKALIASISSFQRRPVVLSRRQYPVERVDETA